MFLTQILVFIYIYICFYNVNTRKKQKNILIHLHWITDHQPTITMQFSSHNECCCFYRHIICLKKNVLIKRVNVSTFLICHHTEFVYVVPATMSQKSKFGNLLSLWNGIPPLTIILNVNYGKSCICRKKRCSSQYFTSSHLHQIVQMVSSFCDPGAQNKSSIMVYL